MGKLGHKRTPALSEFLPVSTAYLVPFLHN